MILLYAWEAVIVGLLGAVIWLGEITLVGHLVATAVLVFVAGCLMLMTWWASQP